MLAIKRLESSDVAGAVMTSHQLVGLSLQVSGERQEIHQSDPFIHLKRHTNRLLQTQQEYHFSLDSRGQEKRKKLH